MVQPPRQALGAYARRVQQAQDVVGQGGAAGAGEGGLVELGREAVEARMDKVSLLVSVGWAGKRRNS